MKAKREDGKLQINFINFFLRDASADYFVSVLHWWLKQIEIKDFVKISIYYGVGAGSCLSRLIVMNLPWSFVPQTLLFLPHVIAKVTAFTASLDTTAIARIYLIIVNGIFVLSLTIFQATRIPTDAQFQHTCAGCKHTGHCWKIK